MLDGQKIKAIVGESVEVVLLDVVDSTNALAKRRAGELAAECDLAPRLFVAREQSAGRGRMGRSFSSRAGAGIFMSLLYFTDKPLVDAVSVTTAAAAVVAEEIERITGERMKIKWVNDIYNDKGKVCGILAETVAVTAEDKQYFAMIVGIGINTGKADFPEELKNIAASIGEIGDGDSLLAARIADRLLQHSKEPEGREYMSAYRARFMLEGKRVRLLQNGEAQVEGIVVGVDDDGGLLLIPEGSDAAIAVRSGEVSVRMTE